MPEIPCPYCGHAASNDAARCADCGGLFEPLSRKATQLAMGPWFVRDEARPFMPGFNEAILRHQVASGRIKADTTVRGPSTHQFWMRADQAPGLSRLLGRCHACGGNVSPEDETCGACQTDLSLPKSVDRLGLSYVDPAERQQVQTEIEALRQGAPPPKPAPKKKAAPTHVDPDLLEPIATEPDEQDDALTDFHSETPHNEFAEDLWQSEVPTTTRRRKRNNGPDPIVLSLAVLLLCVLGVGLFVMIAGSGNPGEDDKDDPFALKGDQDPAKKLPARTADEVSTISESALAAFALLSEQGVPEPFRQELEQAQQIGDQAKLLADAEQYALAYDQYDQLNALVDTLQDQIAQWEADQAIKTQVNELLAEVVVLQGRAESAEAQKYSAGFSQGEAALGRAKLLVGQEKYTEADEHLREAEAAYEEAIGAARQANAALDAQAALIQTMENGPAEQTLREHASALIDRLNASRTEAARKFESGKFTEAHSGYQDALATYNQAIEAVELAKYRKVYAYQAGYASAGVLIQMTAGDGLSPDAKQSLEQTFAKLDLSDNPAASLRPDDTPDYAKAAEQLVTEARRAITGKHGETAQASYHAGFQTRIIEQTLKTSALTSDQQKRIHQCLNVFQDQAAAAGWDIIKLRDAVEKVRSANRLAKVGQDPEQVRAAFSVLIKPFENPRSAARLMDPTLSPSSDTDPELFPGLGSTGP